MVVCSFCRNNYEYPRGTTVVQKDGTARYYCSSKCRKNLEMGRLNKKVKWVRKSRVVKEERAKKDASYKAKKDSVEDEAKKKAFKKSKKE